MKKIFILMIGFSLSGCAVPGAIELASTVGSWAADGLVQAETGKNIPDKLVSDIVGKDCTLKNIFKKKLDICKEIEEE